MEVQPNDGGGEASRSDVSGMRNGAEEHEKPSQTPQTELQMLNGQAEILHSETPDAQVASGPSDAQSRSESIYNNNNGTVDGAVSQIPRHDSVYSFTTAPEQQQQYRNSVASSLAGPSSGAASVSGPSSHARRDTTGSMSMARIAEASEDSTTPTPSQTRPQSGAPSSDQSFSNPAAALQDTSNRSPVPSRSSTSSLKSSRKSQMMASSPPMPQYDQQQSPYASSVPVTVVHDASAPTSRAASRKSSMGLQDGASPMVAQASNSPRLGSSRSSSRLLADTRIGDMIINHESYMASTASLQKSKSSGADSSAASSSQYHTNRSQERRRSSREAVPPVPQPSASSFVYTQSQSYPNLQQQMPYQHDPSAGALPPGAAMHTSRSQFQTHPPAMANQHMQNNRISAPLLNTSPSMGSPYSSYINEPIYTSSPVPMLDAGFGSSSPYPPIGGNGSQQRFSLPSPVLGSTSPHGFSPNPANSQQYQQHPSLSTTSLRPQPTTFYPQSGSSKHLPEMRPSALEARPSVSAPLPPSSSPPRFRKDNSLVAPAAVQQRERPDASRPLGQEICLECLMRDRDMADVEVTGPGVWSRGSDIDFEEALRAEEVAIQQMMAVNGNAGSSMEDGAGGGTGTDENYFGPGSLPSVKSLGREGGTRPPSRESSISDGGSKGFKRQPMPRRRIGGGGPLASNSLKLWTSMNQIPSSQRYKVLTDFVSEQNRYLALEKHASEQSSLERERADRALKESPSKTAFGANGQPQTRPRQSSDARGRPGNRRTRSSQLLANGMTVETISVSKDEKEARARAKAAERGRRVSSQSPTDRSSFSPSIRSFYAPKTGNTEVHESPSVPWLQEQRRRFSSPLLTAKKGNISSDNLAKSRNMGEAAIDLRKSTQSMMISPPARGAPIGGGQRSASPGRQSFQTSIGNPRESRGWRRSFWNRSASASVLSFAHSGSMMEMHLGMSQDKHQNVPPYPAQYAHSPGATWPDSASALDESSGISPDDNLDAAIRDKKKKKGFKKFFNSILSSQPPSSKERRAATEGASRDGNQLSRRESGLSYTAAAAAGAAGPYQDDYSEPLAPPPPLSFLTGAQPHRRSVSSSSQSSASPVMPTHDYAANGRPGSLAVPGNTASSNGFISPSTSSSDLNRYRPSSVTSWRSSSKTGSPQSPREIVQESFGSSMAPVIRQSSIDDVPPGVRLVAGIEIIQDPEPADLGKLRREKSLPAIPPSDEYFLSDQTQMPQSNYPYTFQPQVSRPLNRESRSASIIRPEMYGYPAGNNSYTQSVYSVQQGEGWRYSPEYEDQERMGNQERTSRKSKSKSKLFGFGGNKSRKSTSPSPNPGGMSPRPDQYYQNYVPHEVALQAVVRDNPSEMVAYRYPSATNA